MEQEQQEPLRLAINLSQKVSTAPYETADVSLHISGVTVYSTEEEIAALIEQGQIVYVHMAERVAAMTLEARRKRWDEDSESADPIEEKPVPFSERVRTPATKLPVKAAAPECPICGGAVWDNREDKRNSKSPDFKCKDTACGAAAWINKSGDLKWVDPL